MRSANPIFNVRKVRQFIAPLIIDYGFDCFEDLTFGDKCEFASILMEISGDNECITQSDDFDQIMGHLRKSMSAITDDAEVLYSIKESIVHYYEETMRLLFASELDNFEHERNEWFDYMAKQGDPDEAYDRYMESL